MIRVDEYVDIKVLRNEGLSIRDIAKHLGVSRNTVRKVLRGQHPMKVQVGERRSKLDPFKDYVRQRYAQYQLSAVRLLGEIQPMGYAGSLPTLRRFVQSLKAPNQHLNRVTVRYETPPGKQAQVDWGECGRFVLPSGKPVTIYVFVMVLSYSRALFIHFTTSTRLAELIRCHQLAFEYFSGWPRELLYDNMKQVRLSRHQWNEAFLDFAEHYGFVPKTHRPYRPRTKGKVERQVEYVKDNFLTGRCFESLDELNAQALHWLNHTANVRIHGTTGCVPQQQLAQETLIALNSRPSYQLHQAVKRQVSVEAMVHYQGSRYSVPPHYAGQSVWVHSDAGQIRVMCGETVIAEHRAALKSGQCIVAKDHLAELWKLTLQQLEVPTAPSGERWHLLFNQTVERIPLTRFDEAAA